MIRHLLGIAWHLGGLFALPFLVAFTAALFFEVSEVGDTLPVLLGLSAVLIVPSFFALAVGVVLKVGRELRLLREQRGRVDLESTLGTLHRHLAIVTPRGWAIFLTGMLFVVAALGAKWASLSVVAVFSLMLFYTVVGLTSFVSTFLVGAFEAGMRRRGSIRRQMSPAVILAGEATEERFLFDRVPVPPGYYLLIEDELPLKLGTISRYAVGSGASRQGLVVGGRLRRTPRGSYRVGPANVYYQDVLGLTRLSIASLATATLKVLPRFRPLRIVEPPRSRLETPDILTRPHRFPTEDYFRFREYISGDDTRRIHWKLSVRAGSLTVRQPETKEISTKNVLLALDAWLPRGRMLADSVGVEEILDRLVETWISLAKELTERGDRVTMVAMARDEEGAMKVELLRCSKGGHARWQDLGARVSWQGEADIPRLLEESGDNTHAVVVSSRFAAPVGELGELDLTWVFLPPQDALGDEDLSLVGALGGSRLRALSWLALLPFPAGSDENGFFAQLRILRGTAERLAARRRLRSVAKAQGNRTLAALVGRGDTVYRLEPGAAGHRLVGVAAGRIGAQKKGAA